MSNDVVLRLDRLAKLDPKKVKKNDLMAFVYFARVQDASKDRGQTALNVVNVDSEQEFNVTGNELIESSMSADRFNTEEKLPQGQIAEVLVASFNRPFSVRFTKKDGSKRTLRGRLVSEEHLMGRSMVEDLDIDSKGHRLRQVDHRTIEWLIVDGVKYTVK